MKSLIKPLLLVLVPPTLAVGMAAGAAAQSGAGDTAGAPLARGERSETYMGPIRLSLATLYGLPGLESGGLYYCDVRFDRKKSTLVAEFFTDPKDATPDGPADEEALSEQIDEEHAGTSEGTRTRAIPSASTFLQNARVLLNSKPFEVQGTLRKDGKTVPLSDAQRKALKAVPARIRDLLHYLNLNDLEDDELPPLLRDGVPIRFTLIMDEEGGTLHWKRRPDPSEGLDDAGKPQGTKDSTDGSPSPIITRPAGLNPGSLGTQDSDEHVHPDHAEEISSAIDNLVAAFPELASTQVNMLVSSRHVYEVRGLPMGPLSAGQQASLDRLLHLIDIDYELTHRCPQGLSPGGAVHFSFFVRPTGPHDMAAPDDLLDRRPRQPLPRLRKLPDAIEDSGLADDPLTDPTVLAHVRSMASSYVRLGGVPNHLRGWVGEHFGSRFVHRCSPLEGKALDDWFAHEASLIEHMAEELRSSTLFATLDGELAGRLPGYDRDRRAAALAKQVYSYMFSDAAFKWDYEESLRRTKQQMPLDELAGEHRKMGFAWEDREVLDRRMNRWQEAIRGADQNLPVPPAPPHEPEPPRFGVPADERDDGGAEGGSPRRSAVPDPLDLYSAGAAGQSAGGAPIPAVREGALVSIDTRTPVAALLQAGRPPAATPPAVAAGPATETAGAATGPIRAASAPDARGAVSSSRSHPQ